MANTTCWCGGDAFLEGDELRCFASQYHDPRATGEPEEVHTLYLAGPMTGYPDCNYPQFNRVAGLLEAAGFKVVNPANSDVHAGHYVDFLREDLRWMLDCDAVAVIGTWWLSTGARNEVNVAGVLQMPVLPFEEWVRRGPGLWRSR